VYEYSDGAQSHTISGNGISDRSNTGSSAGAVSTLVTCGIGCNKVDNTPSYSDWFDGKIYRLRIEDTVTGEIVWDTDRDGWGTQIGTGTPTPVAIPASVPWMGDEDALGNPLSNPVTGGDNDFGGVIDFTSGAPDNPANYIRTDALDTDQAGAEQPLEQQYANKDRRNWANFNGASSYVDINTTFTGWLGNEGDEVDCWMYTAGGQESPTLAAGTGTSGVHVSGDLTSVFIGNTDVGNTIVLDSPFPANQWVHLRCYVTGGVGYCEIDGVLQANTSAVSVTCDGNALGRRNSVSLNGRLSDVKVKNNGVDYHWTLYVDSSEELQSQNGTPVDITHNLLTSTLEVT
jgi:hypothetical protein